MEVGGADAPLGGIHQVFLANRQKLRRFLQARGAGDDTDDLLNEIWVKISAKESGPVSDPLSYLYRIALNLTLDRRRRETRRMQRDTAWHEGSVYEQGDTDPITGERILIAREELRAVQSQIETLGPKVAEAFRRYWFDGGSQKQIANAMGISVSSVEKYLQQALRTVEAMRQRLDVGS